MKKGYILLFSALIMVQLSCRHQKEVPTGSVELNIEMPPLVAKTDSVDISEIPVKHEPLDSCLRVSIIPDKLKLPVDTQTMITLFIENHTGKPYEFGGNHSKETDSEGNEIYSGNTLGYDVERLVGGQWKPLESTGRGTLGRGVDLLALYIMPNEKIVVRYAPFNPYYYKYPPGRYRIIADFASRDLAPSERISWPFKGWKDKKGVVFAEFELIR